MVPFVESCSGRFNVFRIAFIFARFRLPFKHHLRQIGVTFCRLFLLLFFLFFIYCMVCLRAFCAFQVGLVYFCPGERFVELIMFIFSLSLPSGCMLLLLLLLLFPLFSIFPGFVLISLLHADTIVVVVVVADWSRFVGLRFCC